MPGTTRINPVSIPFNSISIVHSILPSTACAKGRPCLSCFAGKSRRLEKDLFFFYNA